MKHEQVPHNERKPEASPDGGSLPLQSVDAIPVARSAAQAILVRAETALNAMGANHEGGTGGGRIERPTRATIDKSIRKLDRYWKDRASAQQDPSVPMPERPDSVVLEVAEAAHFDPQIAQEAVLRLALARGIYPLEPQRKAAESHLAELEAKNRLAEAEDDYLRSTVGREYIELKDKQFAQQMRQHALHQDWLTADPQDMPASARRAAAGMREEFSRKNSGILREQERAAAAYSAALQREADHLARTLSPEMRRRLFGSDSRPITGGTVDTLRQATYEGSEERAIVSSVAERLRPEQAALSSAESALQSARRDFEREIEASAVSVDADARLAALRQAHEPAMREVVRALHDLADQTSARASKDQSRTDFARAFQYRFDRGSSAEANLGSASTFEQAARELIS